MNGRNKGREEWRKEANNQQKKEEFVLCLTADLGYTSSPALRLGLISSALFALRLELTAVTPLFSGLWVFTGTVK